MKTNCESGFYLPNTYSLANNEAVIFLRFPHEVKQLLLFYYCFFLIYVCFFLFFFLTFHQEEHVLPEKEGRTYSFIERISLRT